MRQLLLLRHAKSSWDDPSLPDFERPLNLRGRAAAMAMRGAMSGLGLQPDQVLVSTSRRTMETLQALEPWEETPLIDPMDSLYLASAPSLLLAVQNLQPTVRSAMVVAHNPGLHDLALLLTGQAAAVGELSRLREGYPSGALVELLVTAPWAALGEGGARLVRFLCPRDLPQVA